LNNKSLIWFFVIILVFVWVFRGHLQVSNFPPDVENAYADTTGTLRPTADGGNETGQWKNTSGNECSGGGVDCYTEVDESSGSSCTNSDGDTSYLEGVNNGANQTFDISESSITNDSTITALNITVCYQRKDSGSESNTFQTRRCVDGSCTNSGTNITTGTSYAETTQSHAGLSITKSASTDIEIGVSITGSNGKEIRISQIYVDITYTLPDTTAPDAVTDLALSGATTSTIDLAWTAPGDDGSTGTATTYDVRYSTSAINDGNWASATTVTGEPTPSVAGTSEAMTVSGLSADTTYFFALKTSDEVPNESGTSNSPSLSTTAGATPTPTPTPTPDPGDPDDATVTNVGGGGNSPTEIVFSGKAYPGATLGVHLIGDEYDNVLIDGEFTTGSDGSFFKQVVSPVQEIRTYVLLINDRDGKSGKAKFFTREFRSSTRVEWKDLLFPPMIDTNKLSFTRNELLFVTGYAAPGNKIEALIDGTVFESITAESNGLYRIIINTSDIVLGSHKLQTRQISSSGKKSDLSGTKSFKISSFSFANIDMNDDEQINIQDWSIFLTNWSSEDEERHNKDDLNGDGRVDVADFSVFLTSFQLGNR